MLTKRLATCMQYFNNANTLYDVGTDHAYLPIAAIKSGLVKKAYAIDNKKGPLQRALQNIKNYQLENVIETVHCDGLDKLNDLVDHVVIAGMGGQTIHTIVDGLVNPNVNRWIFQPNNGPERVRMLTRTNALTIVEETVVEEDGYFYPIIVMVPGASTLSDDEILFGPILLAKKEPAFLEMLTQEKRYLKTLVESIPDADAKQKQRIRLQKIEEVIHGRAKD